MNLGQALRRLRRSLERLDAAPGEADEILEYLTGLSRGEIHLNPDRKLSEEDANRLRSIADRRATGEPLAYILGRIYFHSRYFAVSPEVLIPRPETEILVETVLARETAVSCRFVDLGTGSGAIAAVLALHRPDWIGFGIDLSLAALGVARRNCPPSVRLLCSDLLSAVSSRARLDFIVSNPPYISARAMAGLDPSVRDFEPPLALRGGTTGTDFYETIARQSRRCLVPGGRVYCEIGFDQGAPVAGILASHGWTSVEVIYDLGSRPRVIRAVSM